MVNKTFLSLFSYLCFAMGSIFMTNQQVAAQDDCPAEAGVIMADEKFLCLDEPIAFTSSDFNANLGYEQLYLLVSEQTQEVVEVSTTTGFNSPGSGQYNIYGFNYSSLENAPELPSIGATLPEVIGGTGCFDLSNTPFQIIVFTAVDIQGTPRCVGTDTTQYFVDISITGGAQASYAINQGPGIIPWNSDAQAGVGEVGPFASGDTAVIVVEKDGTRCLAGAFDTLEVVFTCPPPPDCITEVGELNLIGFGIAVSDTLAELSNETIEVNTINTVLGDNDTLQFLLHNGSSEFIGDILVQNETGIFVFDEDIMNRNTVYFIEAVAGPIDDDGELNLFDDCTVVTDIGQAVFFIAPIEPTVSLTTDCTSSTETFTFSISAIGGVPDFRSLANYTVTIEKDSVALMTMEFSKGDEVVLGPFMEMGTYQIIIEDDAGFSATLEEAANCTVPIELLSFTGKIRNQENVLTWRTSSEYNSDYFLLEHSIDGQNFVAITKVAAAGYSNTVQQYEAKHIATNKINYYRLSQANTDGELKSHGIVTLVKEGMANEPVIVVNPTTNNIDLQLETDKAETIQVDIFDRIGRLAKSYTLQANLGNNVWSLDGNMYTSGIYIARLKTSQGISSIKFLTNRKENNQYLRLISIIIY